MKTLHALLVDDDTQSLETMGIILEMDNYLVSTASNGRAALDRLEGAEENPPKVDFLVLDLDMENLSGIELLIEMRKRGYSLPIMVVTGFASKGTVVELLRQGVCDFLDKPIHMEEFRARVHRLADAALRRRKSAEADMFRPTAASGIRASSVLDLGRLGIPYALRRRIDAACRNDLVLAARKAHGFDILLAEVDGSDPESFYVSVLVKTFFDRWRNEPIGGLEFLATLNGVVLGGSLVPRAVRAMLLRAHTRERILEAYPAGYPASCFLGLGGDHPHSLAWEGEPLGFGSAPGSTTLEIPYSQGDRLFLAPSATAVCAKGPDESLADGRVREAIVGLCDGDLDSMADGIWKHLGDQGPQAEAFGSALSEQAFLLGLELP